jgi:hypothetical protein
MLEARFGRMPQGGAGVDPCAALLKVVGIIR